MKLLDAGQTIRTRMHLLTKYRLDSFRFLISCLSFLFSVFGLGRFFVKRVWSVHRQLGFEPIFRQGGSNHELISQRKSSFDWFSEKAGAGDIVFTLFKSKQLS